LSYTSVPINKIDEILDWLKGNILPNEVTWFRGQVDKEWGLVPQLFRDPRYAERESGLISRFKQNALAYMPNHGPNEWAWLFEMQHFGLPTRLLDWSENLLVGLYFAIERGDSDSKDGALWMLYPNKLNELSSLNNKNPREIVGFGSEDGLNDYLPNSPLPSRRDRKPIAAIAMRSNSRMIAQSAVFTICTMRDPTIDSMDGNHCVKFIIPSTAKMHLQDDLRLMGVTKLTLFPELSNVADEARKEALR
jgi:hypothetical protein